MINQLVYIVASTRHRIMIVTSGKKVKARSSLCDIVHENHKNPANRNVVGRRRCLGLSASIFEFIKPRCSSRAKKRPLATPHQQEKIQPILKSMNRPTLQDWIMSSPSLNVQLSGRVHPSYEEEEIVVEVTEPNLLPIDSLCLERLKLKANDDGDNKQAEEDSSIITRQSGVQGKKKVSFRLPEVADIFFMDSADSYYYSKK